MLMRFDEGFGKLLDDNGRKRSFIKYALTFTEFNESFGKLLNDDEWKRGFLQYGLTMTEFNGSFGKLVNGNARNEKHQKQA